MRIPFWQRFRKRNQWAFPLARMAENERPWIRWTIGAVLAVVLSLLFPQGRSLKFADLKEGSISTKRIVAPFNFEILKTREEYGRDRELAGSQVYPLFVRAADRTETALRNLNRFFTDVQRARESAADEPDRRDSLMAAYPMSQIGLRDWDALLNPSGPVAAREWTLFRESLVRSFRDLMAAGILGLDKNRIKVPDRRVLVYSNDEEALRPLDAFYDLGEARAKTMLTLNRHFSENPLLSKFGSALVQAHLSPNLVYDEALHLQRTQDVAAKVPLSSGFVVEKEKIVDQNERITPEIRKKLVSLDAKMAEKGMKSTGLKQYLPFIGRLGFVCSLIFLFTLFVFMEKPELLSDTKSVFLAAAVILLVGGSAFFLHLLEVSEFFVPVAVGSMLLATLFDERLGFAGTMIMGILVGGIWGNEFALTVVSIFTGAVGVAVIKRVRNRSQILRAVLIMAAVYVFAITVTGLLAYLSPKEIVRQWWPGALMGLFTPLLAYGLLAIVETVFDVTTDFSLLELSNLNHPLLKRLSVEASGTYHHSILVGNLAEAGAQAVGANSLLARVGSYYHDVGKIDKAEYFVENQNRGQNPHRRLAPRMSALILSSHVKMGAELAEEYRLPSTIQDIITQHHGRTLMSLFYQKALAKNGEEAVQEQDYRYPGPRPRTKEAAIVMLADAVEAASRSLKQPNYSRLKGLIEHLVDERFKAGELDRAPVTLRDLESIKENFLTIMAGTFHARIEYPGAEARKPAGQAQSEET
jgi:putative nucleotidyltransferase with HDIG domain